MCTTCGCGDPPSSSRWSLHEEVSWPAMTGSPATTASTSFEARVLPGVNVMGGPGSGKTGPPRGLPPGPPPTRAWAPRRPVLGRPRPTDNDARRLEKAGTPASPSPTGQACHLDAEARPLARSTTLPRRQTRCLFIENVGNLVCPAYLRPRPGGPTSSSWSVTEGEDKPLKYPVMFKTADLVVLTKCDSCSPTCDVGPAEKIPRRLLRGASMPSPRAIETSAKTGQGLDAWIGWLEEQREPFTSPPTIPPAITETRAPPRPLLRARAPPPRPVATALPYDEPTHPRRETSDPSRCGRRRGPLEGREVPSTRTRRIPSATRNCELLAKAREERRPLLARRGGWRGRRNRHGRLRRPPGMALRRRRPPQGSRPRRGEAPSKTAEDALRAQGCPKVNLQVLSENRQAQDLLAPPGLPSGCGDELRPPGPVIAICCLPKNPRRRPRKADPVPAVEGDDLDEMRQVSSSMAMVDPVTWLAAW